MNGFPDCDDMGLAKDHKLQRELDRENRDSAINRAMAEVAGRNLTYLGGWWVEIGPGVLGRTEDELPNYLEDLNAVHEVEKTMRGTDEQYYNDPIIHRRWKEYAYYLLESYGVCATARQRCEAILKTLSRWNPEWDYPI
jgi:hypothetical protein